MVDTIGVNTCFVEGQTMLGFGSTDVYVRRVWVLGPNHLCESCAGDDPACARRPRGDDSLISLSLPSRCCSTTNRRNRAIRSSWEKPALASTRELQFREGFEFSIFRPMPVSFHQRDGLQWIAGGQARIIIIDGSGPHHVELIAYKYCVGC